MVKTVNVANVEALAKKAFKDHVVTEELRVGVFRSWKCAKPGTGVYAFRVTTWPGVVAINGDIGEIMVSRTYDTLAWARNSIESIDYFAEKVITKPVEEFSWDGFEEWAKDYLAQSFDDSGYSDEATYLKYREEVEEALTWEGSLGEEGLYDRLSEVFDGCDYPSFRTYTSNFLWCREALRWFLSKHNEAPVE